jgi:hypothetical protein
MQPEAKETGGDGWKSQEDHGRRLGRRLEG